MTSPAQRTTEVNAALPAGGQPIKTFTRKQYADIQNKERNKADNVNAFLTYARGNSLVEVFVDGSLRLKNAAEFASSGDVRSSDRLSFQASEYIAIADADQVLAPEFLRETVAVIIKDPKLAVLQTAQNLQASDPNPVERVGALITNSLWQVFQRGVDANNGSYCGGTNCVIRWSALADVKKTTETGKVEYFPTSNITEDFYLTLKMLQNAWRVRFMAKTLSQGMPASNLGDHFAQYWRYVEGPIEATISDTIPMMLKNPSFAFSRSGFEFLMKGVQPFYGWFLSFYLTVPFASALGVKLPVVSPYMFWSTWGAMVLFNSNVTKAYTRLVNGNYADHIRAGVLMFLHMPTFCHATYSAIKCQITGTKAAFVRTPKDGTRSRIPLKYSVPLLSFASLNAASLAINIANFCSSGQVWMLEPAFWSMLNVGIISYGLAKFNGVRNTLADLQSGFKAIFKGETTSGA
jgi:hypothetical protein